MMEKRYIAGFDILKFLMAFVIVSLHAGVSRELGRPFGQFCLNFQNLAVPVFFVLSSVLFFNKLFSSQQQDPKAIWRYERRLLILYLIWSVIMIPVTLSLHHYQAQGIAGILYWLKDFFFDYTFYASWFFGALLVGMPLVFLLRNYPWVLLVLVLALYIVFTFYSQLPLWAVSPFEWYHQHLGTPSRSFLFGAIWIGVGCLICKWRLLHIVNQGAIYKWGWILFIGLIVSCLFKPLQIVGVLSILILFFVLDSSKFNLTAWVFLRKCSIIIYCVHYVLIHLLWQLHIENAFLVFFLAGAISFTVASIVVGLSNKKPFGFLKYLY